MQLTHVRLLVDSFSRCFRFYRDVLELRPYWGDEDSGYADFRTGTGCSALALFSRQSQVDVSGSLGGGGTGDRDRVALVFRVPDVDETATRFGDAGVAIVAGPQDQPEWGIRTLHLRDPDGNVIELNSPLPPERWTERLHEDDARYAVAYAADSGTARGDLSADHG
ncbi:MAG TPA: VOC family protein [Actinopolymorphaceae bacterium]|nr:VOC family protein [Actinopolymorphaceae bacterium]